MSASEPTPGRPNRDPVDQGIELFKLAGSRRILALAGLVALCVGMVLLFDMLTPDDAFLEDVKKYLIAFLFVVIAASVSSIFFLAWKLKDDIDPPTSPPTP